MITIVTGGQSGVDTGALDSAVGMHETSKGRDCSWMAVFPTSEQGKAMRESPMPTWLRTAMRDNPEKYELLNTSDYGARTTHVVKKHAQAVVLIAPQVELKSGTKLTRKLAHLCNKPWWQFRNALNSSAWKAEASAIAYWLRATVQPMLATETSIRLMVAGPRESKWAKAEDTARNITNHIITSYNSFTWEGRPVQ